MLPDDERSRAHAPDCELLVPLDLHRLDCDVPHLGAAWPLAQEDGELLEGSWGPLGVHRDRALVGVAHPAEQTQLKRSSPCALAKAHALHGAPEQCPDRPRVLVCACHLCTGPLTTAAHDRTSTSCVEC